MFSVRIMADVVSTDRFHRENETVLIEFVGTLLKTLSFMFKEHVFVL